MLPPLTNFKTRCWHNWLCLRRHACRIHFADSVLLALRAGWWKKHGQCSHCVHLCGNSLVLMAVLTDTTHIRQSYFTLLTMCGFLYILTSFLADLLSDRLLPFSWSVSLPSCPASKSCPRDFLDTQLKSCPTRCVLRAWLFITSPFHHHSFLTSPSPLCFISGAVNMIYLFRYANPIALQQYVLAILCLSCVC